MRINLSTNFWIFAAAINGFIAVAASAMGAHALENIIDEHAMVLFNQAADFQMTHALVLFFTGLLLNNTKPEYVKYLVWAGQSFLVGIILFSGSLYWRAYFGPGSLGMLSVLTPVGGLSLLSGWFILTIINFKTLWPSSQNK